MPTPLSPLANCTLIARAVGLVSCCRQKDSPLKPRFILFRRGPVYYSQDNLTGKQASLRTRDQAEAGAILHAHNEAVRQPYLNLRIAQTYLVASDEKMAQRTWQDVMHEFVLTKTEKNRPRCQRGMEEATFDPLRALKLVETRSEQFVRVLRDGSTSTNICLRRLHNFALGINWLPRPVLPKKLWPPVRFGEKRAVTRGEHAALVAREHDPEHDASDALFGDPAP